MSLLRTVITLVLAGALLGGFIAGWMAPKYLEWNTTSPYATTTQCDLPAVVRQVASDLQRAELIGALSGAGAGLLLGLVLGVRGRKKRNATAALPPSGGSVTVTPATRAPDTTRPPV
jgi:hypothetical protein